MMDFTQRTAGSTSNILTIFLRDATSTDSQDGLTGLLFSTPGLKIYYYRDNATAPVSITPVTMTLGTFTASGFKEVDSTNMPGLYQLCLPNAAFATGAKSVTVMLTGAADLVPETLQVQLVTYDLYPSSGNVPAQIVSVATDALDAAGFSSAAVNKIADGLLKRDMSAVTGEAARSPLNALRRLRNKVSLSGSTFTVTEEDDTTTAWTAVVTTDAGAEPITAIDPS